MTMKPMTAVIIIAAAVLIYIGFGISRPMSVEVDQRPSVAVQIDKHVQQMEAELQRRQATIDAQRAELARLRAVIDAQAKAIAPETPEAARSPVHAANAATLEEMRRNAKAAKEGAK